MVCITTPAAPMIATGRTVPFAKVLVVDDSPADRLAVRRALRGAPIDLYEAGSGSNALSLSREHDYAVILLDAQMPDMDGFEVCARLRAVPKTAGTPIILLTAAHAAAEDALSGYAEGATDYLAKPISNRILGAKVQVFLRLFQQQQALREATAAADRAKAEAERANLARAKFLAAASHDLRQPVQSLILLLEALKGPAGPPQVARAVGCMENALTGLNGLLTGILNVSRFDAGVVMPQMQDVDVGALLTRLAQEYAVAAADRGLRLAHVCRSCLARTDPALLERALRNLVENALRYTPRGGILLGLRRRNGRTRLDVVDSGIGIPADHQPFVFEEFYQVGNSARDRAQGLGLGLSLVARIARLLGAEIQMVSRDGRGTRFSLLLPRLVPACPPSAKDCGCSRILVIEDNSAVRSGLQAMLEGWGYRVLTAASGEDSLRLGEASGWSIDAVIADHRLGPGLTGVAAATEIETRTGRALPTLIITGDDDPARIAEVHASGFHLLHKPLGADELRHRLARLLAAPAPLGSAV